MKPRSSWKQRAIGTLGGTVARALVGSLRLDRSQIPDHINPWLLKGPIGRIGAVWHESIILPTVLFGGPGRVTLISQSGDGDIAAALAQHLGWHVVRGSSSRGGMTAVREIIATAKGNQVDLAIPVDGPRGPRRQVKEGALFLAARTGIPIMAMGLATDRPWRLRSWDSFQIPKPFRRAVVVFGDEFVVPADADRETISCYRDRLQAALEDATALAEKAIADKVPAGRSMVAAAPLSR